jgi:hypothetical protein
MKRCSHMIQIRICGSHTSNFEEFYFLERNAMQSAESHPTFWRTCIFRIDMISQARNQCEAGSKLWRWTWHILPKWQLTFNAINSVISQKIELFRWSNVQCSLWQAGNSEQPLLGVAFKYYYISTEVLIYACGVNWEAKFTFLPCQVLKVSNTTESNMALVTHKTYIFDSALILLK